MAHTVLPLPAISTIERTIHVVRGAKVLLDADLAKLFGTTTGRLNQQVRRNRDRFPPDFMFRLDAEEWSALRSQIAISNDHRGGRRHLPNAFTEHGALMLANVLKSRRASQVSIQVVRTFVKLREFLFSHDDLARQLAKLETDCAGNFATIYKVLEKLTRSPDSRRRRLIGFGR